MQQKELAVWLRAVVVLVFLGAVFLGAYIVPEQGKAFVLQHPAYAGILTPCLAFFWATLLPFFAALVLAWRIFGEIGQDNSFCGKNAQRLRLISWLAFLDTVLYILCAAVLAIFSQLLPGMLLTILATVFVGAAMAVISAALSHLTRKAADLKSENDLTI